MIIDFRVRPPYKSLIDLGINGSSGPIPPRKVRPLMFGATPIPSLEAQSMDMFMQEMDDAGIDKAVIVARRTAHKGLGYGRASFEEIAELAAMHPDRFIPFGAIEPSEGDPAKEVERGAKEFGFKGISMEVGWSDPPLYADDPRLGAVYAKCQELGLIVVMTMSCLVGPDMTYSDPVRLARVAEAFPGVNFVVPHAGWPHVNTMLGAALRCMNIYLVPDFYAYLNNMPMTDEYVTAANGFMRYRTLYASSYPVRTLKQGLDAWKELPFDPEVLELTLHKNAAYLLGMSDE